MSLELFTMCSMFNSFSTCERRHGKKSKVTKWKIENRNWNELLFNGFISNWNERKTNDRTVVFVVNISMIRDGIDFSMICNKKSIKILDNSFFIRDHSLPIQYNRNQRTKKEKRLSLHSTGGHHLYHHQWSSWSKTAIQCNMMQSLYNSLF